MAVVLPPAATSRCNRNAGICPPAATFCCRFQLLRLKDCTHRQRVFIPPHPATAAPSPCSLSLSCRLNPLQLPPRHQTPQSHLRPKLQHLPRRRRRQQSVASLRRHCLLAQALQPPPPCQRHLLLHLHPNQQLPPPQQFSPKTPKLPPASAVLCQKVIHLLLICRTLTSNNHNDTRLHGPCMWPADHSFCSPSSRYSCAAAVAAKPAFSSRDAALAKKEEDKKATQAQKQST